MEPGTPWPGVQSRLQGQVHNRLKKECPTAKPWWQRVRRHRVGQRPDHAYPEIQVCGKGGAVGRRGWTGLLGQLGRLQVRSYPDSGQGSAFLGRNKAARRSYRIGPS